MKLPLLPLVFVACIPHAQDPSRETARSVVLTVAEAVHLADALCAQRALEKHDAKLASTCAKAYAVARPSALAAAEFVDAWNEGAQSKTACALVKSSAALVQMADALRGVGVVLPAALSDALALAPLLEGVCK
jgi:hypothetical protein